MSRSFVRLLAVTALAAVLPTALSAQNACIAVAGTCTISVSGSVTVPTIARLNADLSTANFTLTSNADWAAFFASNKTDTTVVRPVALTLTANSNNLVQIQANGSWSGGGWQVSDVKWMLQNAACVQGTTPTNTLSGTNASLMDVAAGANPFSGTAGSGQTRNLCLGLTIPNNVADSRLTTIGTQTLPIRLTVTAQ